MSDGPAREAVEPGTDLGEACGSCALASVDGCCGGVGHGGGTMRSEREVVAAAGVVALVLSLAVSLVAGTVVWAVVPAVITALGATVVAAAGATALRRGGDAGDRAMRLGVRVLPWVVGGLLVTLLVGVAATLWGG